MIEVMAAIQAALFAITGAPNPAAQRIDAEMSAMTHAPLDGTQSEDDFETID